MRRKFLQRMTALAALAASPLAWPQASAPWPSKPIKLLVPFPPGGSVDPPARAIAQFAGALLGQPIVVETRAGGGTSIAAGAVAKADPDGYTLLFTTMGSQVVHTLQAPRGYDPITDFVPLGAVSRVGYVLVVHPSVPAKTYAELVAYAKANPGKLNFATSGVGSTDHLATELFNARTGAKMPTVPYKGGGPAMVDLLAGRVHAYLTNVAIMKAHIETGALRGLAYTTPPAGMPGAPTFEQVGLKEMNYFEQVNIVMAPKNTPPAVVARLTQAIQQAAEGQEMRNAIQKMSQDPYHLGPAALRQNMVAFREMVQEVVRTANIKFE